MLEALERTEGAQSGMKNDECFLAVFISSSLAVSCSSSSSLSSLNGGDLPNILGLQFLSFCMAMLSKYNRNCFNVMLTEEHCGRAGCLANCRNWCCLLSFPFELSPQIVPGRVAS